MPHPGRRVLPALLTRPHTDQGDFLQQQAVQGHAFPAPADETDDRVTPTATQASHQRHHQRPGDRIEHQINILHRDLRMLTIDQISLLRPSLARQLQPRFG